MAAKTTNPAPGGHSGADFQEGTFQQFRATTEVHLGDLKFSLPAGAVVGFDGSSMKYGGQQYPYPKLLAGINAGFLAPPSFITSPNPQGCKCARLLPLGMSGVRSCGWR